MERLKLGTQFAAIRNEIERIGNQLLHSQPHSTIRDIDRGGEYKNDPQIHTSGDDFSAKEITSVLSKASPYPILTEETGIKNVAADWVWIVDPIDGSTQYHQGLPLYTISVALCHAKGFAPHWGLVYAPGLNVVYEAEKDCGAYRNGTQIKSCVEKKIDQLFVGISAYRSFERVQKLDIYKNTVASIKQIRQFGCPSLDICFVADSKLDARIVAGYKIWDIAAASLIASESGAVMLDPETGGQASLTHPLAILASPANAKTILSAIRK